MRTLNQVELDTVSGGTFRLISCLIGNIKKSNYCAPEPKCEPEPKCRPEPKCPPAPKHKHRGC